MASFGQAKRLGARWVDFGGDQLHWINGRLSFGSLDYEVTEARRRGLGVLIRLGGAPAACSIQPRPAIVTRCPPTTPADLAVYKLFLRRELLRYRNNVTYYESWVEPNHAGRWAPFPSPRQYANLLRAQYSVFRAVNRQYGLHLKLLFAGPADFSIAPRSPGGIAVLPFTHHVLHYLHGQRAFNGIALHGFVFPPKDLPSTHFFVNVKGIPRARHAKGPYPAQGCIARGSRTWCRMTWRQEISAYEQEFAKHGYGKEPLWLSAFGWPGTGRVPTHPQPHADYYPSLARQAKAIRKAYEVILKLPFVQAAFWFNMRDYQPGLPNPDPPFFAHYGLLRYDGSKKPAARVFTQVARGHAGR